MDVVLPIVGNSLALAFAVPALIIHGYRMYQDLFTAERRSVSHRRWLPEKDENYYKVIAWCTFLSVFFSCLGVSCRLLGVFAVNHLSCAMQGISFQFYNFGKLFMYWLFIFRLKAIFGKTSFAYSSRWLNFWAGFFLIFVVTSNIIIVPALLKLNYACEFEFNILFFFNLVMFLFQDVVFSISFILAFLLPLRRVLNKVYKHSHETDDSQHHKKFIYAAVKTTTLTVVTTLSTFWLLIVFATTQVDFTWVDVFFNTTCLFLMTPYYDDAVYYQNICCLCIKCCTPKSQTYKSKESHTTTISVQENKSVTSADTMDQIHIAATGNIKVRGSSDGDEI